MSRERASAQLAIVARLDPRKVASPRIIERVGKITVGIVCEAEEQHMQEAKGGKQDADGQEEGARGREGGMKEVVSEGMERSPGNRVVGK